MRKVIAFLLAFILIVGCFAGITAAFADDAGSDDELLAAYNGKRIGVLTGSIHEKIAMEQFPDSKIFYYNSMSDLAVALSSGLIDAFSCDRQLAKSTIKEKPELAFIGTPLGGLECGVAFAKTEDGDMLRRQMNEFLAKCEADGTMDELRANWTADDAPMIPSDRGNMPTGGRVLQYATIGTVVPMSFVSNGEADGYDVDLAYRFCREYGYGIETTIVETPSIVPGIMAGTYDFASSSIVMTDERKESVNFSDTNYVAELVLVVRNEDVAKEKIGFFESVKSSFEKTFIREQRWKMIVDGIIVTIIISVLSAIFGTILGFGVCLMKRSKSKFLRGFATVYMRILQGTPIVVLLMILFYIVFAGTGINSVAVAVVGFSLNFAAYAGEIMRAGIEGVDIGQTEAALSLGYTKSQAFIHIVMPQAADNFLPVYRGEIVSLLKSTSIVGYIAIQDLTKASDLIRSRTYEAFFPLIATAAIYFLLSFLLGLGLKKIEATVQPKRKKRIIKGVVQK